ncbi:MAG: major capsid protein [Caudoviricetes sp.]|nr:MAG: major capsid protein [Caudoviricetes sp.]
MFVLKTPKELSEMTPEQLESYSVEKQAFESQKEADLNKKLDALTKQNEELTEAQKKEFKSLTEQLNTIKETMGSGSKAEFKDGLRQILKENHAEIVANMKSKGSMEFTFKAPAMHMTNNGTVSMAVGQSISFSDNVQFDNDIAYIRVPENFILNVIRNRQVAKVPQQVIKTSETTKEGAATLVAEGAVKPLIQYKFVRETFERSKYAGRVEWTEEFEMDYTRLLDAIIDMLERDVVTAWQDGLIAIIDANATSYVSSPLDGTLVNPDNGLAVVAVASQIASLGYNPNVVIMNPGALVATTYTQDLDGNFSLKPYIDANGRSIGGLRVVTSTKIPVDTFYVGDFSVYKEEHSDYILRFGQYNTQFIENEYTAIGEVFTILSIASIDEVAIVKGSFTAVKAALEVEVTP